MGDFKTNTGTVLASPLRRTKCSCTAEKNEKQCENNLKFLFNFYFNFKLYTVKAPVTEFYLCKSQIIRNDRQFHIRRFISNLFVLRRFI